jgi:hypothetical protein
VVFVFAVTIPFLLEEVPPIDNGEETREYFIDKITSFGWAHTNTPSVYYDASTDRTYMVFQADLDPNGYDLDPHIMYYQHASSSWSDVYRVAVNPLNHWPPPAFNGDTHGAPCLWIDSEGYIHVLYGAHQSKPIKHARSSTPNDITSFVVQSNPSSGSVQTYPAVLYDTLTNITHLVYRGSPGGYGLVHISSLDNGITWSSEHEFVSTPTEVRPYRGFIELDPNHSEIIHIAWLNHNMLPTETHGADHDFYYCYLNVSNGHVYNVRNHDQGMQVSGADLDNCLVYDYPDDDGSRNGYPDLFLDSHGKPHIFTFIGNSSKFHSPEAWTLKYHYWDSASSQWEDMNITTHYGSGNPAAAIVHDSDNITIFTTGVDRDVHRWTYDGNDWTYREKIGGSTTSHLVSFTQIPAHYRKGNRTEFQVAFTEFLLEDKKVKGYIWGSRGLLGRNYTVGDVSFRANEQHLLDRVRSFWLDKFYQGVRLGSIRFYQGVRLYSWVP